jgi:ribosomal protein L31
MKNIKHYDVNPMTTAEGVRNCVKTQMASTKSKDNSSKGNIKLDNSSQPHPYIFGLVS